MQVSKFTYLYLLLAILACLLTLSTQRKSNSPYDPSKSNALFITRDNFDKQITKHRAKLVSIIHYYKTDDQDLHDIVHEYEKFATEWQGAFRIATVDCFEQYELCEKERVGKTSVIRIYPLSPVPAFDYEGEMSSKSWTGAAARFIQSNVLELNNTNINKFISESMSVPKAILFTDKPSVPLIFKALSNAFEKKIFFGIVRQDQQDIFDKYGVRKTPQIIIVKPTEKRAIPYEGELKYGKIFDFLNIYTETFVPGGENLDFEKPWNREIFPELHKKSVEDICYSHEGYLCGIYLTKSQPDNSAIGVVERLMQKSTENKYKYMWLNVEAQPRFSGAFAVDEYPKLVLLSHGKRKKYVIHEGEFTKDSVEETLEKINNGDARFKHVGEELPALE